MKRALALAARGAGKTSPNPMVGAVVYREGEIVGEGYHWRVGEPHAEVLALEKAGERARGATLVVNLEPCNHHGRTPPCTDLIIHRAIRRVVVSMEDPNLLVAGKGLRKLRDAGIEVEVGVLADEAAALNKAYIKSNTRGLPWIEVKIGCSLDGKLATATGASKYLTSEPSRRLVHRMRARADAVIVGRGTVEADNPLLDCRLAPRSKPPGVVVLDTTGAINPASRLFAVKRRKPVAVAVAGRTAEQARKRFERTGAVIWDLDECETGYLRWVSLLEKCLREGLQHLLVEGGADVFTSLLSEQLADELKLFVAPLIIGSDGVDIFGALGVRELTEAQRFHLEKVRRVGTDVMMVLTPESG